MRNGRNEKGGGGKGEEGNSTRAVLLFSVSGSFLFFWLGQKAARTSKRCEAHSRNPRVFVSFSCRPTGILLLPGAAPLPPFPPPPLDSAGFLLRESSSEETPGLSTSYDRTHRFWGWASLRCGKIDSFLSFLIFSYNGLEQPLVRVAGWLVAVGGLAVPPALLCRVANALNDPHERKRRVPMI